MYDEKCMDFYVAVRAIWILWRRGAWKQLAELGVEQAAIDEPFQCFDLMILEEHQKLLKTDRQTELMLYSLSDEARAVVRSAALTLNLTYAAMFTESKPQKRRHR